MITKAEYYTQESASLNGFCWGKTSSIAKCRSGNSYDQCDTNVGGCQVATEVAPTIPDTTRAISGASQQVTTFPC